jgi:hypothetical protein
MTTVKDDSSIKEALSTLSKISSSKESFIPEILNFYNVEIPCFLVPEVVIAQFTDYENKSELLGTIWLNFENEKALPKAILINNELKGKELLEVLLHEIGHIKTSHSEDFDLSKNLKELVDTYGLDIGYLLTRIASENKAIKWSKREYRKWKKVVK